MYALSTVSAACLLLTTASAAPNYDFRQPRTAQPTATKVVHRRATDTALEPWVTVNDDGKPSTVTPVLTTVDGTTTILSGAPHDVTASVYTQTNYGKVSTSTGSAPIATATSGAAGSFAICDNLEGDYAPWCSPTNGSVLYPGTSYYFLWDPDYFVEKNTSVRVVGNYLNETTGEATDPAFDSGSILASWGFWSLKITTDMLRYQSSKNISLYLASAPTGAVKATTHMGPMIQISKIPGYKPSQGKAPSGAALYIAIPVVFGCVVLFVVGGCIWNRKHRKIDIGDLVSRSRHGYGVGKSGRSRMGLGKRRNKAHERIQLMEREVEADGGQVYRDYPAPDRPRRDSDALGSLAGTPTEDRRMDFHRSTTREGNDQADSGNLFRDELLRQQGEKRF
ncbi:hypothetical protein F5Y15DRAFT_287443 [Xylariaceae sp. FL0016]|nr:hypothetical protein F5Y15DRAFT_287443 [Xylariaceae sp. FL0016]